MSNKLLQLASIAAMMNLEDIGYAKDLPAVKNKKSVVRKGEAKKCKSCENYKRQVQCRKYGRGFRFPSPMDIACENYKKRKDKK